LNQNSERGRVLAAARVGEGIAWGGWGPLLKRPNEASVRGVFSDEILRAVAQTQAVERRPEPKRVPVEGQLTIHPHRDFLAVLLELPGEKVPMGGQAHADAVLPGEVLWGLG